MYGYVDETTGEKVPGYKDISDEIRLNFPEPTEITSEAEKKTFAQLFGKLIKLDNILKNYDEFETVEKSITERQMQDMKSAYIQIRDEVLTSKGLDGDSTSGNTSGENGATLVDFSDLEFEIDLLKTDEINLDYILKLILEKANEFDDKERLKAEVRRVIRSSLGTRAKEELIISFINNTDLSTLENAESILEAFYMYARKEKEKEIEAVIDAENLKDDSKRFIEKAIEKGHVEYAGDELDKIIPAVSRRGGAREQKKLTVLEKIKKVVEVFIGI